MEEYRKGYKTYKGNRVEPIWKGLKGNNIWYFFGICLITFMYCIEDIINRIIPSVFMIVGSYLFFIFILQTGLFKFHKDNKFPNNLQNK